jgi:hypothetical protein
VRATALSHGVKAYDYRDGAQIVSALDGRGAAPPAAPASLRGKRDALMNSRMPVDVVALTRDEILTFRQREIGQ